MHESGGAVIPRWLASSMDADRQHAKQLRRRVAKRPDDPLARVHVGIGEPELVLEVPASFLASRLPALALGGRENDPTCYRRVKLHEYLAICAQVVSCS